MAERHYLQGAEKCDETALFPGSFVFDANIWLSISGPFEDKIRARADAYSGFYKKAIETSSRVYVPQLIASEFINRSIMILAKADNFDHQCKIHQADGYNKWIKEGCDLLHAVVDGNTRLPDGFDNVDLEKCYQDAEAGGIEFHDILIAALCARHGFTLVTDDADYAGQDLPIITWNQRLT